MTRTPLIGISAYEMAVDFTHWRGIRSVLVPATYVYAVQRAGGRPLVLPPLDPGDDAEAAGDLLDVLDGVILIGGPDIEPGIYGQAPHPVCKDFHPERDRAEAALLAAALERDVPVLGVCRGMQLMNVVRGGDLHQHIPEVTDAFHKSVGEFARHEVAIEPGTRLARIAGSGRVTIHSSHHQAPVRLGAGLVPAARADDGTVEALEDPTLRFAIGVLWHPEEDEAGGDALFRELVGAARAYRLRRAA
jgi:putative glutamine amidotransferase